MKYTIKDGKVKYNGKIYNANDTIELTEKQALSIMEYLEPIVEPIIDKIEKKEIKIPKREFKRENK